MKRLFVSIAIIGVIIAVGVVAILSIDSKNQRLYGHIDAVLAEFDGGGDPSSQIDDLKSFFDKSYAPFLGCFVKDEPLQEIGIMISKLKPMYDAECDEFSSECASIKATARKIYYDELPCIYRIL